jgi:branched-chain amino acid transport system substrate-binding protein
MGTRTRAARGRFLIVGVSAALVLAAACGSDDDGGGAATETSAADTATTTAGGDTTGGGTETTAGTETTEGADTTAGTETTEAPDDSAATDGSATSGGSAGCPPIDDSIDAEEGLGAGRFMSDLQCAEEQPLVAEGEPVIIGFQNPEGDPAGSFPEYSLAAEAAVEYINNELGGFGADIQNGVPGRPIQLEVCKMAITPDDSQRCANELIADDPFLIVSSLNFFGNQIPVYQAAGIPAVVGTPITVGDFTAEGVYSIGGGGGCLGVHTGLVEFATTEFGAVDRIGVPWADTPPGVVCYYDLESKPLDVLNGSFPGDSERAGSMPELQHIGVPVKPATPDVTPQVTEILGFEPDAIIFSAQGADCWNFVDGLGRLGWTPDAIPLVLSGACLDFEAMEAAGALAEGIYFIGSGGTVTQDPSGIENPRDKYEAEIYQTKPLDYGLPEAELNKGFATQGWSVMMTIWEMASQLASEGAELTPDTLEAAIAETDNQHAFASTPLSCATAPAPYIAVCNAVVTATQWDGETLVPVRSRFSGLDLIAGTELRPGP